MVASTRLGAWRRKARRGWVATAQSTHVPNSRCEVPCPLGRKSGRPAYPVHCGSIVEGEGALGDQIQAARHGPVGAIHGLYIALGPVTLRDRAIRPALAR